MRTAAIRRVTGGIGTRTRRAARINCRAQRTRRTVRPPRGADPAWRVLADLGLRFGLAGSYASSAAIFDEVAARVPAFAGLSYRVLGPGGAMVREG